MYKMLYAEFEKDLRGVKLVEKKSEGGNRFKKDEESEYELDNLFKLLEKYSKLMDLNLKKIEISKFQP